MMPAAVDEESGEGRSEGGCGGGGGGRKRTTTATSVVRRMMKGRGRNWELVDAHPTITRDGAHRAAELFSKAAAAAKLSARYGYGTGGET